MYIVTSITWTHFYPVSHTFPDVCLSFSLVLFVLFFFNSLFPLSISLLHLSPMSCPVSISVFSLLLLLFSPFFHPLFLYHLLLIFLPTTHPYENKKEKIIKINHSSNIPIQQGRDLFFVCAMDFVNQTLLWNKWTCSFGKLKIRTGFKCFPSTYDS